MEVFRKNLLKHDPHPLNHKPSELEHENLIVSMFTDNNNDPVFVIRTSRKQVYDRRSITNSIRLNKQDFRSIIANVEAKLDQIDQGEIVVCRCSGYTFAGEGCCEFCNRERVRLWKLGGNKMVKAYGYEPIEETE